MDDQVTLSAYSDQVRELIRHDRNDEAVAICKHILRYHPKYIDAYRQLGEALLEKGDYEGAKEIFRRVLSADPENTIAYVALASIFEQAHVINEAVWHLERAFELAPGNSELQKELLRLYNEMDSQPHARARLTAGALGRLYAQAGSFGQAIQEFRSILASTPSRYDIRVALAEALWRTGRMSEAAQVAQSILEQLPYCLKANLIVGAAWKETGLLESDLYLQRARMLDPLNQMAVRLMGMRSPLPLLKTSVPRYFEGGQASSVEITPSEMTPALESPVEESAPVSAFESMPNPAPTETAPALELPGEEPAPVSTFESMASPTLAEMTPADAAIPSETPAEPATPIMSDEHLPPWLRRSAASAQTAETRTQSAAEETADWLSRLRQMPVEEPEEESPSTPLAEWLGGLKKQAAEEPQAPPTSEEFLAWRPGLEAEPAVTAPSPEAAQVAETEPAQPLPAWLRGIEEQTTPTALAEEPALPEALTEELSPRLAKPSPPTESVPPVSVPPQSTQTALEPPATWVSKPKTQTEAAAEETAWQAEAITPGILETGAGAPVIAGIPRAPTEPKGDAHLVEARAHRDANRIGDALVEYDYVVQHAPRLVKEVIADLELLTQRPHAPLQAHRILGDAYTRANRLAEALERYRLVLEHIA